MRPESRFLVLTEAATTLASALLAGEADDAQVQRLVSKSSTAATLDQDVVEWAVFTLAMRDPALLIAEPAAALRAQLMGLILATSADHASLWLVEKGETLCMVRAGKSVAAGRLRAAAHSVVADTRVAVGGELHAEPVERQGIRCGALVYRLRHGGMGRGSAYAAETALAAAAILERQALREQIIVSGEELSEVADRRIARLGFDIHDGPLQTLALLAGELAALSRYLQRADAIVDEARIKLMELKTLGVEVGTELRVIASGAVPGGLNLLEAVEREVDRFKQSTDTCVDVTIVGDLEVMSTAQQNAAARVVEEALNNVRQHSSATRVKVSLNQDWGRVELSVADDGCGFDIPRTRQRARRDGCLGLLSMEQRVRLLGGEFNINSRPGGPTVVSASLPTWEPIRRAGRHGQSARRRAGAQPKAGRS